MTKFHHNNSVPTNVYYNNQVVNKVFYTDADGNNTEVWPLTPAAPTTSIGTTLAAVNVFADPDPIAFRPPRQRIIVNFLDNGFLEIQSEEVSEVGGSSLTTIPAHSSSFNQSNQPSKTISDEFKWISTASSGSTFSGYQFKCGDNENTGSALVETGALATFDTYTGFTLGTAQLRLDKTGNGDSQNTHTFTIKDPNGNEVSFSIDFQINITL
tara:strand:- start:495 stop:1130 length:636 start_codon:yes stop_codon:yes gene_type:complete